MVERGSPPEGAAGKEPDVTITETRLLTADDLLRLYGEGVRGELIRGVLYETKPAGLEHGEIAVRLGFELGCFIKPQRLGSLAICSGYWLEHDPDYSAWCRHRVHLGGENPAGRAD